MQCFICASRTNQNVISNNLSPKSFQFLNCVQVWYNPEGYHSLPAYLNSLNNFILRANLPKNETSRYGKCPFTWADNFSPLGGISWFCWNGCQHLPWLQWGHVFIPNDAIPLKTELKNMNKSHISFVFVKDSGELDREDPSSYVKQFFHPKNANGCYLIYCLSSWYWNSCLLIGAH